MTGFRAACFCLALAGLSLLSPPCRAAAIPSPNVPAHLVNPVRPFPIHFTVAGGEVHGSIYSIVDRARTFAALVSVGAPIFLPDITVYLQNAANSATAGAARTDLDGTFSIASQPVGSYRVCWKAPGYVAGCSPSPIALGKTNIYLKPIGIAPVAGVVFGRVALKDGAACRFLLPVFARNTFTIVQAKPASGPVHLARANSSGLYVLPALPAGTVSLTARCEGAQATTSATVGGGPTLANMTLPNARPVMNIAYIEQGGRAVRAAAVGTTVHAVANVADGGGYPLHYRWGVGQNSPGFVSADAPGVSWVVPSGPGATWIYLLAYDNRGGNLYWTIPLSTTPNRIGFSGRVVTNRLAVTGAPEQGPVPDATVSINGVVTHTDSNGAFALTLHAEAPRYVATITKPGYQMLSRALYSTVQQGIFKLYPAQVFTADPTKAIALTERPLNDQKTGAQILIGPNALALGSDGRGGHATGALHLQVASYNLEDAQDQVPGDYGGIDKNGRGVRMESFGAVDVALADGAGRPVNLAPGNSAVVRVPIAPASMAEAPATIPVWHYDTSRGMWTEDGVATKVGSFYETRVTHFSAVNMDLAYTNAACTRIVVDTSIMPVPFRLQMTTLSGGPAQQANHQNQIVGDALNVVVREPPGLQVRFDIVDSNGSVLANASQTITVGAASPSGSLWNPPPNPPYADCTTQVTYNEQTMKGIFPPAPNGFLTFQTPAAYLNTTPNTATGDPSCGTAGNPNCDQADALTVAYYHAIDPGGTKTAPGDTNDFANWKNLNGFTRSGVVRVAYQNVYDLGFGRDMYMQTGGQTAGSCPACVAFYVTNYCLIPNNCGGEDAADAAATQDTTQLIATVAMEYGPLNNTGSSYTRFYVFNAKGAILNAADLDDFGAKNVPALCVICHNGNIASNATTTELAADNGNLTFARFIPFDVQSYLEPLAANTPPNQTANFNAMNTAILTQTNPSAALVSLITTWYGHEGNLTAPNTSYNGDAVPSEWSSASTLYSDVVKTSCRGCHATRDPSDPGVSQDLSWGSYANSFDVDSEPSIIEFRTCSSPTNVHPMPQAERTFSRFWLSTNPNAPITLANAGLSGWNTPPACP